MFVKEKINKTLDIFFIFIYSFIAELYGVYPYSFLIYKGEGSVQVQGFL